MTREEHLHITEQIKEYLCEGNPIWDVDMIAEAMDAAIEAIKFRGAYEIAVKAANKAFEKRWTQWVNWIPCEEELPGKGENVLVTNNWHEVRMAYLTDRTRGKVLCWIVDHNSYHPVDRNEILAWMHLPTPFFEPTLEEEGEKE